MKAIKITTSERIEFIEQALNDYCFSKYYKVNPITLEITNQVKPENAKHFEVRKYRTGYRLLHLQKL